MTKLMTTTSKQVADLRRAIQDERKRLDAIAEQPAPQVIDESDPLQEPDLITWIEQNFYIPELNGPMQLAPYQKQVLREATKRDRKGNYLYSLVLWSDIKKSAKSTIAAARALHQAVTKPWSQINVVANDERQSNTRVFEYLRRAIQLNPRLGAICNVTRGKVTLANNSTIEALAIDPKGEAGANSDLTIVDELWGWNSDAHETLFAELSPPPTKAGRSQVWISSYAGYDGESKVLQRLYELVVKDAHRINDDIEMFATRKNFALWNTTPRLPWQTEDYYVDQQAKLSPNEFARVHRNEWVSSINTFCDPSWLDYCTDPTPPPTFNDVCVLGIDASLKDDNTAIIAAYPHPDNRRRIALKLLKIWKPTADNPISFDDIEAEVLLWRTRTNIQAIAFDIYQMASTAKRLSDQGLNMVEFGQGEPRTKADSELRTDISQRQVVIDSGSPELIEHLKKASAKASGEDRNRLVKPASGAKIDAAVAASMALATFRNVFPSGQDTISARTASASIVPRANLSQSSAPAPLGFDPNKPAPTPWMNRPAPMIGMPQQQQRGRSQWDDHF